MMIESQYLADQCPFEVLIKTLRIDEGEQRQGKKGLDVCCRTCQIIKTLAPLNSLRSLPRIKLPSVVFPLLRPIDLVSKAGSKKGVVQINEILPHPARFKKENEEKRPTSCSLIERD